jgi:hypothetical protein
MNQNLRNIVRAGVVGIATGMILGGLLPMVGLEFPPYVGTIGVGVVIAITYVWLNNHTS